ncbi:hypothetical protein [Lactobacillus amylovorus]|uniref:hypothetical protein n=1 Tax=Lactobacillus amylovorus TaxID=1604 RepID=UPI00232B6577|nr:hypothetical protein [Lactobacillus amylovorus]MDB6268910.1 hypothetical protein [Lactobacillus amylovorus]MDB6270053.1 hypothetical protein [Lactobacillus amylovorus]
MIYDSQPWRDLLADIKDEIQEVNTEEKFKSDDENTSSVLEKDIFLSAFVIRKLIDCKSKVIDKLRDYTFKVKTYKPIKRVDFFHRWPGDGCFDLEKSKEIHVNEKLICNSLIHSYVFWTELKEENGPVQGFYVSSDKDKNKILYRVNMEDYIKFLTLAIDSEVLDQEIKFDKEKQDYVFKNS